MKKKNKSTIVPYRSVTVRIPHVRDQTTFGWLHGVLKVSIGVVRLVIAYFLYGQWQLIRFIFFLWEAPFIEDWLEDWYRGWLLIIGYRGSKIVPSRDVIFQSQFPNNNRFRPSLLIWGWGGGLWTLLRIIRRSQILATIIYTRYSGVFAIGGAGRDATNSAHLWIRYRNFILVKLSRQLFRRIRPKVGFWGSSFFGGQVYGVRSFNSRQLSPQFTDQVRWLVPVAAKIFGGYEVPTPHRRIFDRVPENTRLFRSGVGWWVWYKILNTFWGTYSVLIRPVRLFYAVYSRWAYSQQLRIYVWGNLPGLATITNNAAHNYRNIFLDVLGWGDRYVGTQFIYTHEDNFILSPDTHRADRSDFTVEELMCGLSPHIFQTFVMDRFSPALIDTIELRPARLRWFSDAGLLHPNSNIHILRRRFWLRLRWRLLIYRSGVLEGGLHRRRSRRAVWPISRNSGQFVFWGQGNRRSFIGAGLAVFAKSKKGSKRRLLGGFRQSVNFTLYRRPAATNAIKHRYGVTKLSINGNNRLLNTHLIQSNWTFLKMRLHTGLLLFNVGDLYQVPKATKIPLTILVWQYGVQARVIKNAPPVWLYNSSTPYHWVEVGARSFDKVKFPILVHRGRHRASMRWWRFSGWDLMFDNWATISLGSRFIENTSTVSTYWSKLENFEKIPLSELEPKNPKYWEFYEQRHHRV